MERRLIEAVRAAQPALPVYHNVAPDHARPPFLVLQRVGGAGHLYLEQGAEGYEVRFQVACWASDHVAAVALSRSVEQALLDLPAVCAQGAALAAVDADTGWAGMRQDFLVID